MYMTIRHYRVPPSKMDEVVRRVDELWLDRLSKLEGFESYFVMRADESHLTSVSAFIEEAAGRKAAEASAERVGNGARRRRRASSRRGGRLGGVAFGTSGSHRSSAGELQAAAEAGRAVEDRGQGRKRA